MDKKARTDTVACGPEPLSARSAAGEIDLGRVLYDQDRTTRDGGPRALDVRLQDHLRIDRVVGEEAPDSDLVLAPAADGLQNERPALDHALKQLGIQAVQSDVGHGEGLLDSVGTPINHGPTLPAAESHRHTRLIDAHSSCGADV